MQQTETIELGESTDTDRAYFSKNIKFVLENIPRITSLINDLSKAGMVDASNMDACSASLNKLEAQLKSAASLGRSALPPLISANSSSSSSTPSEASTKLPRFSPISHGQDSTSSEQPTGDGGDHKRTRRL